MTFTPSEIPDEIRTAIGKVQRLVLPAQGMTSEVAVVESASGTFVVKCARQPLFMNWLKQEYGVLKALEPLRLPVPQAHVFVERSASKGSDCWLLMSHVPGTSLDQHLRVERDTNLRLHIARQWGTILRQIHTAPAPPMLAPRTATWLDDQLQQARFNLDHYACDGDDVLLRALEAKRPPPVDQLLIHGDFTLNNTLIEGDRISGVIDWSGGAYGDPRYDLSLALEVKPGIFGTDAEITAFWDGYGSPIEIEFEYFHNLYEFF